MGVLAPTVMVMVELPAPGTGIGFGLKLTVVPDGMPEAESVKFGAAVTVSVTVAFCWMPPPLPVTVIG